MSVPTAKKLRETYGPAIDATVGMLHRVVQVDAGDLSAMLDMAEEAEEAEKTQAEEAGKTQHIADLWHNLALLHGYNAMAKQSNLLSEKVYCRLGVQAAERQLGLLGVAIERDDTDNGPVVLTLPHHPPYIEFRASDIELMRQAVANHDAKKNPTT